MKQRSQLSVPTRTRCAVELSLNQRWLKFILPLVLVTSIGGFWSNVQAQRIEYVKGVLAPTHIKEGDMLKIGTPLTTSANGRIILAYAWKTIATDLPCETYWIMNGSLNAKVPNLDKPERGPGTHPTNCGGSTVDGIKEALSEKATGIHIVAFSGYPGKGVGDPTDMFRRSMPVLQPLERAIDQGIRGLPRSFSGKFTSLTGGRVSITDEAGNVFEGKTTNETQTRGGESLQAIVGAGVYVEYLTGTPHEIRKLIRTDSPQFYEYLGFHEEQSYSGDCSNLPAGKICLKFADGFVSLVDEQKQPLNESQSQYGLTIESFTSETSQYLHINGSRFVNKILPGN